MMRSNSQVTAALEFEEIDILDAGMAPSFVPTFTAMSTPVEGETPPPHPPTPPDTTGTP